MDERPDDGPHLAALTDADLDSRMHPGAVDVLDERPDGVRPAALAGLVALLGDDLEIGRRRTTPGHQTDGRDDSRQSHSRHLRSRSLAIAVIWISSVPA
jgi:hypothetical protein